MSVVLTEGGGAHISAPPVYVNTLSLYTGFPLTRGQRFVNVDGGNFDHICSGSLDGGVDSLTFRLATSTAVMTRDAR